MLELKDIQKSYPLHVVLERQCLNLEVGIYWIKGSNGSGKTTLLKLIAALIPFDGDIVFNGISVKKSPVLYRQQVGWAEAEPVYPTFITGMDLVKFYQKLRKAPASQIEKLRSLFKMEAYLHHPIGTYSAGMTKKLSLLLAFLGEPPLCILDEPLITLDEEAYTATCRLIEDNHARLGTTFLLSSHQDLNTPLIQKGHELTLSHQRLSFSQ